MPAAMPVMFCSATPAFKNCFGSCSMNGVTTPNPKSPTIRTMRSSCLANSKSSLMNAVLICSCPIRLGLCSCQKCADLGHNSYLLHLSDICWSGLTPSGPSELPVQCIAHGRTSEDCEELTSENNPKPA